MEDKLHGRNSITTRRIGASNKGIAPEKTIPLWQALNPFTLNLNPEEKSILYNYIATKNEHTSKHIVPSPYGGYYVGFGTMEPKPYLIKKFRKKVYRNLPKWFRDNIPDHIRIKYSDNGYLEEKLLE
jgi:hypothetical protein